MATHIPPLPNLNPKTKNETLALLHGIYAGLIGFSTLVFLYLEYQQASISTLSLGMVLLLLGGLVFFNIRGFLNLPQGLRKIPAHRSPGYFPGSDPPRHRGRCPASPPAPAA